MGDEKRFLIDNLNSRGVDVLFLLQEAFLGYKERKRRDKLYSDSATVPTKLIEAYYSLHPGTVVLDNFKKAFVTHYIKNESEIEEVTKNDIHGKEEMEGMSEMYNYIHSDDINYLFDIYTLKDIHAKLYSKCPFPEYGGTFRNWDVYLPNTGNELSEWSMIRTKLDALNPEVARLHSISELVKYVGDPKQVIQYLDDCVVLGCNIIKIHPFGDGNGRTVRGFINKLLEDAGLPPIYLKVNERTAYHDAMNKANCDGDYSHIKSFYRYKVCDSLIELDINDRVKGIYNNGDNPNSAGFQKQFY